MPKTLNIYAFNSNLKQVLSFQLKGHKFNPSKKLFAKLENCHNSKKYGNDTWKIYQKIIQKTRYAVGKKFTTHIKNLNGYIRHFLARFRCKTKCYSKSIKMLEYSLYTVFCSCFLMSSFVNPEPHANQLVILILCKLHSNFRCKFECKSLFYKNF